MSHRAIAYEDYEWIIRPDRPARHVAELSEALGAEQVRMNVWRYEPGARGKRHRHVVQDETFVVVRGVLTMYLGDAMERVEMEPGDVVHVGHGTPLQTANEGEEDLVVYVHGWPPEDEHAELLPSAV
jgi:quercetin dioxygenase-like cupin family protein